MEAYGGIPAGYYIWRWCAVGSWLEFLDDVERVARGVPYPFFRGCASSGHTLLPSLFRMRRRRWVEVNIFYDFVSSAKPVIDTARLRPIETLFEMRHAGIPTRLLDWTTTFGVALYFAVNSGAEDPCVWILEPDVLNRNSIGDGLLVQSDAVDYDDGVVRYQGKKLELPLAIFPTMQSSRIFAQKGHFTIHGAREEPLEVLCPGCVTKIPVPRDAVGEARRFLLLAGINEYSIFPDVDGLARFLIKEHGLDKRKRSPRGRTKR